MRLLEEDLLSNFFKFYSTQSRKRRTCFLFEATLIPWLSRVKNLCLDLDGALTLVTLVSLRQGLSSALEQEVPGSWLLSSPKYYYYWLRHNLELAGCLGVT